MSTPCEFFTAPTAPLVLDWSKRNLLINGCGRVVQRGGDGISLTSGDYIIDRWKVTFNTGAMSSLWSASDPDMFNLPSFGVKVDTPPTLGTDGYFYGPTQAIEANVSYRIRAGTTVTLRFGFRATVAGVYCVRWTFDADIGTQYYFQEFTVDNADTLEYQELHLDVPENYVPPAGTDRGINVLIAPIGGTNRLADPGSFITPGSPAESTTPNCVNWAASADNEIRVCQAQLEIRDGASRFDDRLYSEELAMCQRYFYDFDGSVIGTGHTHSTTQVRAICPIPVTMRDNPVFDASSSLRFYGGGSFYNCTVVSLDKKGYLVIESTGMPLYEGGSIYCFPATLDAEL